jgi:transposase
MRGTDLRQGGVFSYVSLEERIPKDHPLRRVREMVDLALAELSPDFEAMYSKIGRPSIPPEKLLRALLLQVLYTIRSERMLMEQLDYNLLFRWFVGLEMDDGVWVSTVFTKNRDRLLEGDIARAFLARVLEQAKKHQFLSDEHFTVDGTLVEAWAGQKSFRPKESKGGPPDATPPEGPRNPTVDFHGQKRSNTTHQSTTDPDARLCKKARGHEAKLAYMGHALMENRNGLVVNTCVTHATGYAEREAALEMIEEIAGAHRVTIGADKGYDTRDFVRRARDQGVTAHVAQNTRNRRSAVDRRTTRHDGYAVSQRARKRVEEVFGWIKTVGAMRKTRHKGVGRVGWMFTLAAAAYNLVRMRNLLEAT